MTELKPCPFCGGEASIDIIDLPDEKCYSVYCGNAGCDMYVATYEYRGSEAEAVEVWNRRHVETCHDANTRFNAWVCSECDSTVLLMFDDYGEPTLNIDGTASTPNYCPNCGRKVDG